MHTGTPRVVPHDVSELTLATLYHRTPAALDIIKDSGFCAIFIRILPADSCVKPHACLLDVVHCRTKKWTRISE